MQQDIRQEYRAQVKATKKLAQETAEQDLTPGERAEVARREQADTQRARSGVPKSAPTPADGRRSPEWNREVTLPISDDELMKEVGDDF